MRISVDAYKKDFGPALSWLAASVGRDVRDRVTKYRQHTQGDALLAAHYEETYALAFALADACAYRRNTGRVPSGDAHKELFSFAVPAMRIHQRLPEEAKPAFEGKLRDLVNGTFGARPLAYEIGMATHLMAKGCDVEFADYGGTAQFDLLARKDGSELEIECKTTSGDTGRKVHCPAFHPSLRPDTSHTDHFGPPLGIIGDEFSKLLG